MKWDDLRALKGHPVAEVFPMMGKDDAARLNESMKSQGYNLAHPITLFEGMVLDGRNRLMTALKLNEEGLMEAPPPCIDYAGDTPATFVVSENLTRRHMTVSEKSIAAARLLPHLKSERQRGGDQTSRRQQSPQLGTLLGGGEKEKKGRAVKEAARQFGIGKGTVERAARVLNAPDLLEKVEKGEMTVSAADEQLRERQGKKTYKKAGSEKLTGKKAGGNKATEWVDKKPPYEGGDSMANVLFADGVVRNGRYRLPSRSGDNRLTVVSITLCHFDVSSAARFIKQYLTATEMESFIHELRTQPIQPYPDFSVPSGGGNGQGTEQFGDNEDEASVDRLETAQPGIQAGHPGFPPN